MECQAFGELRGDYSDDQILLCEGVPHQQEKKKSKQLEKEESMSLDSARKGYSWPRTSLRARVAAEAQGSHRDILMTAMNCNDLEKRALGKP